MEFRTHITLSSIAESTRWCNYSKGKFGEEISVILPTNLQEVSEYGYRYINWYDRLKSYELNYIESIKEHNTPQFARGFLPFDVKSELIMCGFKDAWDNFFYRRCAVDAHPDAQYIAKQLKNKIYETKTD